MLQLGLKLPIERIMNHLLDIYGFGELEIERCQKQLIVQLEMEPHAAINIVDDNFFNITST